MVKQKVDLPYWWKEEYPNMEWKLKNGKKLKQLTLESWEKHEI